MPARIVIDDRYAHAQSAHVVEARRPSSGSLHNHLKDSAFYGVDYLGGSVGNPITGAVKSRCPPNKVKANEKLATQQTQQPGSTRMDNLLWFASYIQQRSEDSEPQPRASTPLHDTPGGYLGHGDGNHQVEGEGREWSPRLSHAAPPPSRAPPMQVTAARSEGKRESCEEGCRDRPRSIVYITAALWDQYCWQSKSLTSHDKSESGMDIHTSIQDKIREESALRLLRENAQRQASERGQLLSGVQGKGGTGDLGKGGEDVEGVIRKPLPNPPNAYLTYIF